MNFLLALCSAGATLACLGLCSDARAERDPRCAELLTQAVAQLAAEQYPRMLQHSEDRMLLCPDPTSSFVLGLAQANMVDSLAVQDPAQRELMRREALQNLRIAAAGGSTLQPRWQLSVHEWIVYLQALGPAGDGAGSERFGTERSAPDRLLGAGYPEPLDIPPAPPPQAQPSFPWGPVLTGTLGLGALTTGIALGVSASDKASEAESATRELSLLSQEGGAEPNQVATWARQTRALHEEAQRQGRWATALMVSGGAALLAAGVWYGLMPPEGKWRWAVSPAGVQTTVRF